jgi:ABC-type amino acid transport substrate-binding protein
MAKLMYEDNEFGEDIDYNVVSASNIGNSILQKSADIAILPINMASKILNDGKDYKIISTVTNGNLYIVGNKDITSLGDLKNEVVGIFGAGNVPTLTLKYLLSSNNIEYASTEDEQIVDGKVALEDYVEASYLIPALKKGDISFGLLPEPAVSKLLKMSDETARVLLIDYDLQFGDISYISSIKPKRTISDLNDLEDIDQDALEAHLEYHKKGDFYVLAAPLKPHFADQIRPEIIEKIIKVAKRNFDFVIVDSMQGFNKASILATSVFLIFPCNSNISIIATLISQAGISRISRSLFLDIR